MVSSSKLNPQWEWKSHKTFCGYSGGYRFIPKMYRRTIVCKRVVTEQSIRLFLVVHRIYNVETLFASIRSISSNSGAVWWCLFTLFCCLHRLLTNFLLLPSCHFGASSIYLPIHTTYVRHHHDTSVHLSVLVQSSLLSIFFLASLLNDYGFFSFHSPGRYAGRLFLFVVLLSSSVTRSVVLWKKENPHILYPYLPIQAKYNPVDTGVWRQARTKKTERRESSH